MAKPDPSYLHSMRMMFTRLGSLNAIALLAGALACQAQGRGDALSVELFATREVLKHYKPVAISVDSFFARAGHAPPLMTSSTRPLERQRAFRDSLQSLAGTGTRVAVRIRASEPVLRQSEARIFVTVDELQPETGRAHDYETVGFVLDWRDGKWVIRERIDLGRS